MSCVKVSRTFLSVPGPWIFKIKLIHFQMTPTVVPWTECLNLLLQPLPFIYWSPNSHCDGIRRWRLQRAMWFRPGHEGWGSHDGISALIWRDQRTFSPSLSPHLFLCPDSTPHIRTQREDCKPRRGASSKLTMLHPDPDLQPSDWGEVHFCCLCHPVYDILLWLPKPTRTNFQSITYVFRIPWFFCFNIEICTTCMEL